MKLTHGRNILLNILCFAKATAEVVSSFPSQCSVFFAKCEFFRTCGSFTVCNIKICCSSTLELQSILIFQPLKLTRGRNILCLENRQEKLYPHSHHNVPFFLQNVNYFAHEEVSRFAILKLVVVLH